LGTCGGNGASPSQVYRLKAGLRQDAYLERWLAITAGLLALSALVYAVRLARAGRAG